MPNSDENLGVAFALVIAAGASTAIGAGVVFFPALVKYASRKVLAGSLGLSAGVMTYVSFVEIFVKSSSSFEDAGIDEDKAAVYATLCFFAGVVCMITLNHVVSALLGGHHHHHQHPDEGKHVNSHTNPVSNEESVDVQGQNQNNDQRRPSVSKEAIPMIPCCSEDPGADLDEFKAVAASMEAFEHERRTNDEQPDPTNVEETGGRSLESEMSDDDHPDETHKLMRMSVNTAVAIALHNFPEGLATFVATLSDPGVGAVLALAIAIHNIPEGLCVAMPIYYATGNRLKAFCWGVLSGVSEPLAALLGWAVLANSFTDELYAILFGLVAGMMVIISARELLPTAHRYDPEDSVVTYSFMVGMAIMALSLVLFRL